MKFTLNNFYSNNYKDFIHLEALKNILRKVPELNLAGLENIENVLSMEFSVDDWGENPMYIKYVDTDGKEHIVKIRPAVTEQIYEILKAYAKISYVDEQDKKLKDELHTEITQGDENALNLSKAYTDTVVNHAKDEINHTIETTKQDLKGYCDNKCEITLASSKEYTDTKAHELSQRIDELSVGGRNYLLGTADFTWPTGVGDWNNPEKTIEQYNSDLKMLHVSNSIRGGIYTKWAGAFPNGELQIGENYTFSFDAKGTGTFLSVGNESDNQATKTSVAGTFLTVGNESDNQATKNSVVGTALTPSWKRYSVSGTITALNKAFVIYFKPNYNVYIKCVKIEKGNMATDWTPAPEDTINKLSSINGKIKTTNQQVASNKENIANNSNRIDTTNQLITANDNKTTQALADVNSKIDNQVNSLNGKIETTNQQVASNKEAITNNSNRIDTANQLITANDNKTTQALTDVNSRIDNIPRASEVTRSGGKFKGRLNVEIDAPNDFYSTVFLEQRDGSDGEFVGRLVKGDVAKKSDLDALNGDVSNILSWKNSVDNKLEQKRWRMFEVRPEEYTPLNGANIDRGQSYTRFFQFDNYALFITDVAINHLTMNTWTYKELVSFPKAYLEHFSRFQHFTNTILTGDGPILYGAGLDFDKAKLTIYSRGTEINDANISLQVGGILYN